MRHTRPQLGRKRAVVVGAVGVAAMVVTAVAALATAGSDDGQAIVCPSPVGALSAVPDAARTEVARELANLDKQLKEANERLARSEGEGGPNFVDNAILGPLASKRTAALDRIAIAIGRVDGQRPAGLADFAECALGEAGEAGETVEVTTAPADPAAGGQAIECPSPVGALAEVPAAAEDEVARELANLDKQLAEANERLVDTEGQGGPNFVDNAILGPLASKRTAALNRIETAIGRVAEKPEGLERFAECSVG
ncbi:hypothetical protein ADK67_28980 [Saccharothrix sp. NRRL B-16348]|uniref:hypothetical protein n=1 Tax=Saccharothrix sp. NRRL B-16348 TaxID=1415542 RepID=UPI0006BED29F|nr:hypothetical protein [Saccharothrix sp. NRRL B-16348]KOX20614.1 hypothetical protein ADK67_28980 [Saccharothrix sp. NRRL B-16348]